MNLRIKLKTLWNRGLINSAALVFRYLYARAASLPYSVMIEPADRCNLNCAICYTQKVQRKREKNLLSFGDFKKIVDEIKNHCVYINLWIAGEPLLSRELEQMVAYAHKKNIITCISTNAMLLTKERAEGLVKAGLDRLIVSFDGATKESYEKIRIGAKFETVLNNIRELVKIKKTHPFISLQLVVTNKNEAEIPLFAKLAKELNVDEAYTKSLYPATQLDNETTKKILSLRPANKRYVRNVVNRNAGCLAKERTAIQCDGVVVPCCFDVETVYPFGNVLKQNFNDIWRSKEYADFRKSKLRYIKSPLCSSCGCSRDYRIETLIK